MVKLIVGARGSGKTKHLIELVNDAAAVTKGSVVCVEYGNTLNFDVTHKARLVDTTAFSIANADALYGFIAGLAASDHDITDIFVDAAMKICNYDLAAVEYLIGKVAKLADTYEFNLIMTISANPDDISDNLRKYI